MAGKLTLVRDGTNNDEQTITEEVEGEVKNTEVEKGYDFSAVIKKREEIRKKDLERRKEYNEKTKRAYKLKGKGK